MRKLSSFRWALLGALTLQSVVPLPVLLAGDRFGGWSKPRPKTPIEEMAAAIDQLEKRIDTYGSVVIKQPDVWGEARWTAHRQDYEEVLRRERDNFQFTINAQIREADSAFLLNAAALGNALSAGSDKTAPTVSQVFQTPTAGGFPGPTPLGLPTANVVDSRNTTQQVQGVAIEPTLFLDQLSRYVEHLNQLRRINEGDDTADAPGYALNLIRLPVSALPGDMTRSGFGAEVTLTLTPELSDDLLPETFKDFVLNDVVDQLGLPLVNLAEQENWKLDQKIEEEKQKEKGRYKELVQLLGTFLPTNDSNEEIRRSRLVQLQLVALLRELVGDQRDVSIEAIPLELRDQIRQSRANFRRQLDHVCLITFGRSLDHTLALAHAYTSLDTLPDIAPYEVDDNNTAQQFVKTVREALEEVRQKDIQYESSIQKLLAILPEASQAQGKNLAFAIQAAPRDIAKAGVNIQAALKDSKIQELSKTSRDNLGLGGDEAPRYAIQSPLADLYSEADSVLADIPGIGILGIESLLSKYSTADEAEKARIKITFRVLRHFIAQLLKAPDADKDWKRGQEISKYWDERIGGVENSAKDIKSQISKDSNDILQMAMAASVDIALFSRGAGVSIASPRHRQARYPIPPTEIACVFGREELLVMAEALRNANPPGKDSQIQLMDAHAFLTEELEAAYSFLSSLKKEGLYDAWACLCPRLSRAIRQLDYTSMESLDCLRTEFHTAVGWDAAKANGSCQALAIRALAWAILVESALLSDHLLSDMERTEKAKGASFLPGYPLAFYGSDPDPTARQAFNEYVRVRWPIHTFAVDPVNQEQNVSEAYARRRETQLALALAFTSGQIGANNFSRFSRQLDYELQTIELNRTVVGFSHGADTFGWRLYPRVQAPPIEGNAKVAFRDLLCGGPKRDHDLKQRQLEPGARELLAIVIMPSFVPYLRLDARTNWFQLTDPNRKQFTTEDSVRLGQMIQYVKHCKTQCLTEGEMTRGGDVRRLLTAVDQLEKRLPLQDTLVQIPYQNSQGGFRLFADGTKNLGPELIGFYGEPGYNSARGSDIFLVGDNFNVNVTRVVIGGKMCKYELLSRQVMKVEIPAAITTMTIQQYQNAVLKEVDVVDAHVATPYGVSSHLHIPVVSQSPPAANPRTFSPGEIFGCLTYDDCYANGLQVADNAIKLTGIPKDKPGTLTISATALFGDGKERTLNRYTEILGKPVQSLEWPIAVLGEDGNTFTFSKDRLAQEIQPFFTGDATPRAQENVAALRITAKLSVEGAPAADVTPLLIKIGSSNRNCLTCPAPAACPANCPPVLWAPPICPPAGPLIGPAPSESAGKPAEVTPPPREYSPSEPLPPAPPPAMPVPALPTAPPPGTSEGTDNRGLAPKAPQGVSPVRSAKGWLPVFGGARR